MILRWFKYPYQYSSIFIFYFLNVVEDKLSIKVLLITDVRILHRFLLHLILYFLIFLPFMTDFDIFQVGHFFHSVLLVGSKFFASFSRCFSWLRLWSTRNCGNLKLDALTSLRGANDARQKPS